VSAACQRVLGGRRSTVLLKVFLAESPVGDVGAPPEGRTPFGGLPNIHGSLKIGGILDSTTLQPGGRTIDRSLKFPRERREGGVCMTSSSDSEESRYAG
jgi:hypothetical protein